MDSTPLQGTRHPAGCKYTNEPYDIAINQYCRGIRLPGLEQVLQPAAL